jgi:DNA-binding NtrC family response regulator
LRSPLDAPTAFYILYHYRRLNGSTPELCALLGLNRRQLYYRLKRLGIALRVERKKLEGRGVEEKA